MKLLLECFCGLEYFFKTVLCFGYDLVGVLDWNRTEDWAAASCMIQPKRGKYLELCSDDLVTMYCLYLRLHMWCNTLSV